ncbi:MAG TPA: PadR family transcriptional regulator [Bacillus sp. (in: firmicutes)]|nr:PadR family transcriptional regulator [Bacillus sp. (in: firmicutes)]
MDKEIMKGSIDILILSVIAQGYTYGYEITKSLKEKSNDLYQMSEGTLYPALKRLEKKGCLESYWGESVTAARRKHYRLTDKGKEELSKKTKEWQQVNHLIQLCTEGL